MENLPGSFVNLILKMTGMHTHRHDLATYFGSHFEGALTSVKLNLGLEKVVEAKTIALVEDFHLKPQLLECFSLTYLTLSKCKILQRTRIFLMSFNHLKRCMSSGVVEFW